MSQTQGSCSFAACRTLLGDRGQSGNGGCAHAMMPRRIHTSRSRSRSLESQTTLVDNLTPSCACIPRWGVASFPPAMPAWGEPMVGRVFSLQFGLNPSCRAQSTDLRGADYREVFRSRCSALDLRWPKGSQGKAFSRSTKYYPRSDNDLVIHTRCEYRTPTRFLNQRPPVCNRRRSVVTCSVACDKIASRLRGTRCRPNSRLHAEYSYITSHLLIAQSA
jgi:hypothetical protein